MNTSLAAFAGYGIEIEYAIVDSTNLSIMPIADTLCSESQSTGLHLDSIACSNELPLHQIELKNEVPTADLAMLADNFQQAARRINELLTDANARLMPGGMHPWMNPAAETRLWPHAQAEIYAAYDRIFNCHRHGHANVQSMQVNLPFQNDNEFARLHEAVRLALPIIPALAASSPFADGRWSGFKDYRLETYRTHQQRIPSTIGEVIPEIACSKNEYEMKVLAPMYREIAPHDPEGILQHEWLNARAAIPRFDRNAIEIRLPDMQECPQTDLAIASAIIALVRHIYETSPNQMPADTRALLALLRACIKDAEHAVIADEAYLRRLDFPGRRCEARELWQHLIETLQHSYPLVHLSKLQFIFRHGTLASRLLGAVGIKAEHSRMEAVYRELCACLHEGRMFE